MITSLDNYIQLSLSCKMPIFIFPGTFIFAVSKNKANSLLYFFFKVESDEILMEEKRFCST